MFADRLTEYRTGKGTIQLPLEPIREIAIGCYRRYAKECPGRVYLR